MQPIDLFPLSLDEFPLPLFKGEVQAAFVGKVTDPSVNSDTYGRCPDHIIKRSLHDPRTNKRPPGVTLRPAGERDRTGYQRW